MAEVIKMPRMSDTMTEGNIVSWLKKEGDRVEPGETLAEVETDKATMELDSFFEGVLLHIAVKSGPVPINGVIAVIGEPGEDWKAAIAAAGGSSNGSSEKPTTAPAGSHKTESTPAIASTEAPALPTPLDSRIKASPLAKSMAKEQGIDLSSLSGSGDMGRIVRKDIEAFLENRKELPAAVSHQGTVPAFSYVSSGEPFEDQPLSQMRKTIARRLGESKFSAPHFYLTIEVDMDKAVEVRKSLNEVAPVKLSFNDMIIKVVAASLLQHPAVNSSWMGDKIRRNREIHIGVAVAVDEGLLVPVIRHANLKSLSQINVEVKDLAEKAKARKLQPEEMQGNTFTISNLGMLGIEEFTAIINPPDACILAVGSIVEKPVAKAGQIVIGNRMKVTMSCDHRVVDGATGAQFLQTFKSIMEDPVRLLV